MKSKSTNWRNWPRGLSWLAGAEGAAISAVIFAVPFLIKRVIALRGDSDAFDQTCAADLFSVSLEATANAELVRAFETIVPIDVPSIMPGYGLLPAVTGIEEQTGAWDAIGQTRIVRLADHSMAREEITDYQAPHFFAYTVSDWSGALKHLAREARSEWEWSEITANQTRITWRYTFAPRSIWTAWLLLAATQGMWRGAMKQALRECVRQAELSD